MERTVLKIGIIRTDGGTQPRALIDFDAVSDYLDAMKDGVEFPPITVFYDGTDYWLADGFHRLKAAFGADFEEIACHVHQGTQEDAKWYSFGANKGNGLRRTNDDIRRAIEAALRHPNADKLSDTKIAEHIGCGHSWVSEIRNRIFPGRKDKRRTVTRNGKTYEMDTANIGQRQAGGVELPQSDSTSRVASYWLNRIDKACSRIASCPSAAHDLAVAIRSSKSKGQIAKHLEKTREFITTVLAEADLD